MKRNIDLNEISDGRLYTANDMVKADCHECVGCSACCSGMGESIILDPYDIHRLCEGLNTTFEKLIQEYIELHVVDGLILPNLRMKGEKECCGFLDEHGRCSIHPYRPGICRMFPLGRVYEDTGFQYFLQIHECPVKNKGKVKVKKWLDTSNLKQYEQYITDWHGLITYCQKESENLSPEQLQVLTVLLLKTFYQTPYKQDFYQDFYERLDQIKRQLNISGS